jgi:lysozyme
MKINEAGLKIIREYEGLRLEAYLCPSNKWTIGFGNTFYKDGSPVRKGDTITREDAEGLLLHVVNDFADQVSNAVQVSLTSNQFSAIVSLVFNIGPGNFRSSTLLRKLNAGDYHGASEEFGKWCYSNGTRLRGLIKRRKEEQKLFVQNDV